MSLNKCKGTLEIMSLNKCRGTLEIMSLNKCRGTLEIMSLNKCRGTLDSLFKSNFYLDLEDHELSHFQGSRDWELEGRGKSLKMFCILLNL